VAEEIEFGNFTSKAEKDLRMATKMAYAQVHV